jgi:hypothetical protein
MCGAIPPLPKYVFMAWCLVQHRDNFNFILLILQYVITLKYFHYNGEISVTVSCEQNKALLNSLSFSNITITTQI